MESVLPGRARSGGAGFERARARAARGITGRLSAGGTARGPQEISGGSSTGIAGRPFVSWRAPVVGGIGGSGVVTFGCRRRGSSGAGKRAASNHCFGQIRGLVRTVHAKSGHGISGRVLLSAIAGKSSGSTDGGAEGGGKVTHVRLCVGTGGGAGIQLRSHGRGIGGVKQKPRPCPPQSAGDCLERVSFGRAEPDWRRAATV